MPNIKTVFLWIFIFQFSPFAFAKDEWFCTSESSAILQGKVQACGIGIGKDESEARLNAFDNAQAEFRKLCEASDRCHGRETDVEPKRTTCTATATGFKCYRMIVFEIQSSLKRNSVENHSHDSNHVGIERPSKQEKKNHTRTEIINTTPGPIKIRVSNFKLRRGMKKSEVISMFGTPEDTNSNEAFMTFHYGESEFCSNSCQVYFDKLGYVTTWGSVRPEFTTDLDDVPVPSPKKKPTVEPPPPGLEKWLCENGEVQYCMFIEK